MPLPLLGRLSLLGALVAVGAGCDLGGDSKSPVDEAQFIVEFQATLERTVEGEARAGLTALPQTKTRVVIDVDDASDPLLRAEIRTGSCDMITSGPVYLLKDVDDGKSETVVDVPLAELRGGPGYIIMITALKQRTEYAGLCGSLFDAEVN
jgi:hypothetical protein